MKTSPQLTRRAFLKPSGLTEAFWSVVVGSLAMGLTFYGAGCASAGKSAKGEKAAKALTGKPAEVEAAAQKALAFYASIMQKGEWGKGGGWCITYTEDLSRRGGEANQDIPLDVIRIQPPATPNVGQVFLRASVVLGDAQYLEVARQTADALMRGQSSQGGWNYEMWLPADGPKGIHVYPKLPEWTQQRGPKPTDLGVLDDEATFAPAEFLYVMWRVTKDGQYFRSWVKAMDFLLQCQLPGGGYQQMYPSKGYHAYATFNDGVMLGCVNTLLRAYERTAEEKYLKSAIKCGDFLLRAQTPEGGYGAQITDDGKVADARRFEPPALGPDSTRDAITILSTIYEWTGDMKYLAPLNQAAAWLEKVQIAPGRWARYYHPETAKPWYRTLEGKDVPTAAEAKGGYTWEGSWGKAGIEQAKAYSGKGPGKPRTVAKGDPQAGYKLRGGGIGGGGGKFGNNVDRIVASETEKGYWIYRNRIHTGQWITHMERMLDAIEQAQGKKLEPAAAAASKPWTR
jgi:hypothetical protein